MNVVAIVIADLVILYIELTTGQMRDIIRDNMSSWMVLTDSLEQKLEFIDLKSEYSDIYLLYLVISVIFTAVTAIFFRTVFREFRRLLGEKGSHGRLAKLCQMVYVLQRMVKFVTH